jgi:L-fuculose-phosphate aldolase
VPSYARERELIVELGRRLWLRGFVASNDGNLSIRLSNGRLLVTPSGISKGFMEPSELVVVSADGRVLEGARPTSELAVHLTVYRTRSDIGGVVHAHPPSATAFAVAGADLDAGFLPEMVVTLGEVPTAPYRTPSTPELAASIEPFVERHDAMLLANHGALTMGRDLEEAYERMETVEHAADIALRARLLGGTRRLSEKQLEALRALAPNDRGRE